MPHEQTDRNVTQVISVEMLEWGYVTKATTDANYLIHCRKDVSIGAEGATQAEI